MKCFKASVVVVGCGILLNVNIVCKDSDSYCTVYMYTFDCFPVVFDGETAACTLIVTTLR